MVKLNSTGIQTSAGLVALLRQLLCCRRASWQGLWIPDIYYWVAVVSEYLPHGFTWLQGTLFDNRKEPAWAANGGQP